MLGKQGNSKRRETRLSCSEQLARPTDFEICFSNHEAIVGILHDFQPLLSGV